MQQEQPVYKKIKIRRSERNLDSTKVPLLKSFHDPWVLKTYINNTEEYELIYKRARYKNSQDLLYHNLKLKSDPLLGSGSSSNNLSTIALETSSNAGGIF